MEPEKTEQEGIMEPPSVGDMEQTSTRRGSVRLNTFETMLDPSEIVNTLAKVRSRQHTGVFTVVMTLAPRGHSLVVLQTAVSLRG